MEVYSTAENVNETNNFIGDIVSNISENVQKCRDEETYNRKDDESVEKYMVCDTVSQNREDCNHEEFSKKHELGVNNKCSSKNNMTTAHENVEMENENNSIIAHNNGDVNNDNINERSKRFLDLIDEDSDEEMISCEKNWKTDKTRKIINSESEDLQTNNDIVHTTLHKTTDNITNSYQTLLNTNSEEEKTESTRNFFLFDNAETSRSKDVKQISVKKKGSIRASKEEAMHKIYSESQRLLRETDISLPYHRPKQRTLQEFLNRRKISAALPKASSTAAKLKMSSTIVSRVLTEKEKEAERFYKSSDSEDDAQQLISFGNNNIKKSFAVDEKVPSTNVELTCVQDSQEIGVSNHKSHLDGNPSRTSIGKDFVKGNEDKKVSSLIENSINRDHESNMLLTKKITNKNIQSVLRRLFEDSTNKVSDYVTHDQQETEQTSTKEIVETVVMSVDDGEYINKEKKSEADETDHVIEILNSQLCDSDVTNKHMKTLDNTNNKETTKTFESDKETVATIKSDKCIRTKDRNDKSEEKRNETDNVSSSVSIDNALSETQSNFSVENRKSSDRVFGLPLPTFTDDTSTNRKRSLPESLSNSEVRLKGLPGTIINLTEDTKSSGKNVNTLLNRFFSKHLVKTKKQSDSKPEITVIYLEDTPNGPLPVKETVPYKMPVDNDNPELNKPGAKLIRLKEDLKLQMIIKRNKEWKEKEIEQRHNEKWNEEDEEDYGLSRDSPDEQSGFTADSSESEESEPEENDVCIKDKKRRTCLFADDEAEVTDDEETNAESGAEDSNEQSRARLEPRGGRSSDVSDTEIDKEEEEEEAEMDEDADVEDDESECDVKSDDANVYKNKKDRRTSMQEDFQDEDSSITASSSVKGSDRNRLKDITSENENEMPVYQRAEVTARTQECETPFAKTSMLDFISPVTQLSVLNTIVDSAKKDSSKKVERPVDKSFFVENVTQSNKSPVEINGTFVKKRLFNDTEETIDDEYLMRLCSGKFVSQMQNIVSDLKDFSSQFVKQSGNETSQGITTKMDEDLDNSVKRSEVSAVSKEQSKLTVVSSDDESHSDEAEIFLKPKKRPLRRLSLSDSEEENAESSGNETSDVENEKEDIQYVDYDSEENEVAVPEKDIKKVAARFVEEEAELSESDWDSADEDERDLDKLDFEEGDNEQLDEHEIRNQLGKMRMKQMLDEDKRDVRLLKELLFEDGDLYTDGTGRERKFKWRNIDKSGSNAETSGQLLDEQDNSIDEQDHEEEAEWHRLRQERDKFLEEKMKSLNNELENELCDSQIFKPFKRSRSNECQRLSASPDKADPSQNMEPIMPRTLTDLLNGPSVGKKSQMIYGITKKSSFLSRGDESLARIASLAKQGDSVSHALNTRNFVFQYISPSTDSTLKEDEADEVDLKNESRKRKTTSNFLLATKKRRR